MEKVKMINAVTGTEMWVAKDRVFEYRAAGHKQVGKLFKNPEPVATSQKNDLPDEKTPGEEIIEKTAALKKAAAKAPAKRKK